MLGECHWCRNVQVDMDWLFRDDSGYRCSPNASEVTIAFYCQFMRLCCEYLGKYSGQYFWTANNFSYRLLVVVYKFFFRYFAEHVSLGCDLGRKIGRAEFNLPNNVLELVYGQSLIWCVWCSHLDLIAKIFYNKRCFCCLNVQNVKQKNSFFHRPVGIFITIGDAADIFSM